MKVPKIKPIIELMNGALDYNSRQIPLRPNGSISKVNVLQGYGFIVIIIEGFVLVMELGSD
jgi:hypothetical protein